MAKVNDHRPAELVYEAATRWRKECLDADGSLFTPGEPVWTPAALDELENCFVLQPDTGKGSYLEKLHKQLSGVSDTAVQLMAELHAVHFLMWWTEGSGAISPDVKRSQLTTILSWRDGLPPVPKDIHDAMGTGIARMGQWALSRRDTQINYLIEFSRAWKRLSSDERAHLADDPWALLAFGKTIDVASSESQRAAVMHLLHPDTFEPMVSNRHKDLVIARYKALAGGQSDPDRALLAIRHKLEPSLGQGFHFYLDPIVHTWQKDLDKWKPLCRWVTAMKQMPGFEEAEVTFKLDAGKGLAPVRQASSTAVTGSRR
jgi:5-methylcytosine-specific restriction protein B